MKHIFFTAIAALSCATLFAADDWKTYFKNDRIEIQYNYSDCHDEVNGLHQEKVLLKFINISVVKQEVSFAKELIYNDSKSLSSDEKRFSLILEPNEIKEGLCTDRNKALFIFSKQLRFTSSELKKFDLKNISVKTIQ